MIASRHFYSLTQHTPAFVATDSAYGVHEFVSLDGSSLAFRPLDQRYMYMCRRNTGNVLHCDRGGIHHICIEAFRSTSYLRDSTIVV